MSRAGNRPTDVTGLLACWTEGDSAALEDLLPAVYSELRALAAGQLHSERSDHTLQPTALVHEAYLRLVRQDPGRVDHRTHFFALAAKAMRRVLVDHARRKSAEKRAGGRTRITLTDSLETPRPEDDGVDLLVLNDSLERLASFQPRAARVVELRYFGGLTVAEVADVLEVSTPTVQRDWTAARVWLHESLSPGLFSSA